MPPPRPRLPRCQLGPDPFAQAGTPHRSRDAHAVGRPSVIFSRRFHCGDYLGNLRIPQHGLFWESTGEIM